MTVPHIPRRTTRDYQQLDAAHHIHAFVEQKALNAAGPRVMVRGEGIYLWDSEGKKILDGMSGLWCVNVGYGRHSISKAVFEQMETLPFYNSFFNTTNVPAVTLAARLAQIAPLHQMAQDAYKLGKGTILELIDALGSITEHRLEHLELVKDMLDAEWEVRLASGDLPQVQP